VLFRTNAQSESFEQALAERGIPAVLKGVERFFERAEIRQAGVLLRGQAKAAVVPAASTGAGGAGGGPSDGEGLGQVVRGVLAGAGWSAQAPAGTGAVRDRWESLTALVSMADEYAATNPRAGLPDFMTELDRRAAIQHAPVADGVTLATLHAAKGLEWRCVFIAGAHEGTLPIAYAQTPRQVEEERRLFYVGITRAKDRLMVSWAAARSPGGPAQRGPTRFLDPLGFGRSAPAATTTGAAGTGRKRGGRTVPRCRVCGRGLLEPAARKLGRCEDCPSTLDEDLYARLLAWRTERAAEQKVPAYVVFTDATLTAIAEIRPADQLELLRISGIGKVKVDRYGEDVVRICRG
jgi:DNA helicase II / ATP-dependent DNA helicase PcrA